MSGTRRNKRERLGDPDNIVCHITDHLGDDTNDRTDPRWRQRYCS
jgi:hypothetical protein